MSKWRTVKLKDVTTKIGSGSTPRGGESVYISEGTSLIRSQNIYDFEFEKEGLVYIDEKAASKLKNVTIEPRDILLNITGDSVGRCSIVPADVLPARVNQHVCIIRTDKETSPHYLMYVLNEQRNKERLLNQVHGGTRKALTKSIIEEFEVTIPDYKTQNLITSLLCNLDIKIQLNNTINNTLEQIAQTLYKHWFIDFGPFQEEKFKESELGLIPKGWQVGKLKDFAKTVGKNVDVTKLKNIVPYIGLEHMPKGSISLLEWETSDKITSSKTFFTKGDILFGKLRPYFKKVGIAPIDGICSTDILVINAKEDWFYGFLVCLLSQDMFIDYCSNSSSGTRMPRTNWKQMEEYKTIIPPKEVLLKFNDTLLNFTNEILSNVYQNRTLIETRNYLLPFLLSGKIEVKEAAKIAKEVLTNG